MIENGAPGENRTLIDRISSAITYQSATGALLNRPSITHSLRIQMFRIIPKIIVAATSRIVIR